MSSPESAGFGESFNHAFDLVRSMAMSQREKLVAEADPRSERTFDVVKELVFGVDSQADFELTA